MLNTIILFAIVSIETFLVTKEKDPDIRIRDRIWLWITLVAAATLCPLLDIWGLGLLGLLISATTITLEELSIGISRVRPRVVAYNSAILIFLAFWQGFKLFDQGIAWSLWWSATITLVILLALWKAHTVASRKKQKKFLTFLCLILLICSGYYIAAFHFNWWPVVVKAETKQEETKPEETKQEETKQEKETKQEETKQEETKQDLKKALTFDEAFLADPELSKIFRSVDLRFDDSSLLPAAKERNKAAGFSHAVAFPFVDYSEWDSQTRNKEFFKQIIISVLKNPIMADMLAQGFVWDMEVPSLGTTVGNLNGNEFMEEFVTMYSEKGLEGFLINKNGLWEVTPEFRKTAEKLTAVLWSASRIRGIETLASRINYASNGDLVIPSGTRTYRVTDPEYQTSSEALVLEIPNPKDGKYPELIFGFNRHDRRLEVYPRKAETPEKPKPQPEKPKPQPEKPKPQPEKPKPQPEQPKPTPEKPKPQPHPQPQPQPQPEPQPNPQPTPKKPESDPSQKGRADIGGGPNQVTDSTGVFQKQEPTSSETLETTVDDKEVKKIDNSNPPSDTADKTVEDSHDKDDDGAGENNGPFQPSN